ncbi:MBL fold metallo-hydrolase [Streptomyces sp. NPDC052309]|uniref:MBL fold metallo-hydrolase n=1 Tax=Streptomyces sp. NPDC052309 TaxID=3155421 RepID=UPI0034243559
MTHDAYRSESPARRDRTGSRPRSMDRRTVLGGTAAAASAALFPALAADTAAAAPGRTFPANRLVLLGTAGGPPPEPGRAGMSSALTVDGRVYLVDAGRAAVTQYLAAGLRYRDLTAVFVTHLHADHVTDLHNFFLLPGFGVNDSGDGITSAVDVHGPGPAGGLPPVYGGGPYPPSPPPTRLPGSRTCWPDRSRRSPTAPTSSCGTPASPTSGT